MEPSLHQDILVCQSDSKEILEDENDEEISESTETDPTHPLTYRSQDEITDNSEHSTNVDPNTASKLKVSLIQLSVNIFTYYNFSSAY